MTEERNLDFDHVVSRKNTDCVKFDFAAEHGMPEEILPLWVADMDFQTSSRIVDAVTERTQHGIFGYTDTKDNYYQAVAGWMKEKHHWEVQREWLVKTPGVVFALATAVKAYTEPGENVLVQQPVYHPFSGMVENNGRNVVSSDLILGEDGRYHIDFEDFEKTIVEKKVRLFLLCSPHNPVSRVWTRDELQKLGEICVKHHVTVVSDEIHEDFIFGEVPHTVFADIDPAFAEISITCTSPGKTFNLAGLQVSNIFIPSKELREKFRKEIQATGYGLLNTLGVIACEAAYRYGDDWYQGMMKYVKANIDFLRNYLEDNLPELTLIEPEGTYLVWIDCRKLGLPEEKLEDLIVNKAKLWLDNGSMFGPAGAGFERINVACPRATLEKALKQLEKAVHGKE